MPKIWLQDEIDFLSEHYADNYAEDLAKALDRNIRGVYMKANELGLRKSSQFLRDQIEPLLQSQISQRYKKGMVPHNKGKAMPEHVREKVSKTWFKTGGVPHNTKDRDGVITKRSDGYWYIRLKIGHWRQLHTHTWEQANRPINSKTEMVKFKDGNRDNCNLENLYLSDRRQNMLENTIQRYPPELKATIKTLAALKRQIKQHEK